MKEKLKVAISFVFGGGIALIGVVFFNTKLFLVKNQINKSIYWEMSINENMEFNGGCRVCQAAYVPEKGIYYFDLPYIFRINLSNNASLKNILIYDISSENIKIVDPGSSSAFNDEYNNKYIEIKRNGEVYRIYTGLSLENSSVITNTMSYDEAVKTMRSFKVDEEACTDNKECFLSLMYEFENHEDLYLKPKLIYTLIQLEDNAGRRDYYVALTKDSDRINGNLPDYGYSYKIISLDEFRDITYLKEFINGNKDDVLHQDILESCAAFSMGADIGIYDICNLINNDQKIQELHNSILKNINKIEENNF